jgi:hypothetical protein
MALPMFHHLSMRTIFKNHTPSNLPIWMEKKQSSFSHIRLEKSRQTVFFSDRSGF